MGEIDLLQMATEPTGWNPICSTGHAGLRRTQSLSQISGSKTELPILVARAAPDMGGGGVTGVRSSGPKVRLAVYVVILAAASNLAAQAQVHPNIDTRFAKPEPQLGSRETVKPATLDAAAAGSIEKRFARCVYNRNRSKVADLLNNSDPVSIDYHAAYLSSKNLASAFQMDNCLGDEADFERELQIKTTPDTLRFMLAEEDYLRSFPAGPGFHNTGKESLDRTFVTHTDGLSQAQGLAALADCLTFKDSARSDTLLRTDPGTAEEKVAALALAPDVGSCLFQGQDFKMTVNAIRRLAADGMWNRYVGMRH